MSSQDSGFTSYTIRTVGQKIDLIDGVCHCPKDEIEFFVSVNDSDEFVDVKNGKCRRCFGTRINSLGIIKKGFYRKHEVSVKPIQRTLGAST